MLPTHYPIFMNGMNMPKSDGDAAKSGAATDPIAFLTGGDGSIILPKITTTTIRARPERCMIRNAPVLCFNVVGRAVAERLMPPPSGIPQGANPEAFTALIADDGGWVAWTFDNERAPDAVYRSGVLFLPYNPHLAVLHRMRADGSALIALTSARRECGIHLACRIRAAYNIFSEASRQQAWLSLEPPKSSHARPRQIRQFELARRSIGSRLTTTGDYHSVTSTSLMI